MRGIGEALPIWRSLDGAALYSGLSLFAIATPRFVPLVPMLDHRNGDGKTDEGEGAGRGSQAEGTAPRARLAGQDDANHQVRDAHAHEPGQPAPQATEMPLLLGQAARVRGARIVLALHVGHPVL
jgi:hypothetical protein